MAGSIIELKKVSYRYPSGQIALEDISIGFQKGKKVALMGANGAGKSTLLLLLNGIHKPYKGELTYFGEQYSYKRKALNQLRQNVGVVFQDSDNQLVAPSVFEEVSFGLLNIGDDKEWIRHQLENYLDKFDLQDIRNRSPHQLSSGQKKRVCLASVLCMEPEVVVCDEPVSNLDPVNAKKTFQLLEAQSQLGRTIIFSTHDVNLAYEWADEVVLMKQGRVLRTGGVREVLSDIKLLNNAGLDLPYLVELALMKNKDLNSKELPRNAEELLKLLNNRVSGVENEYSL